MAQAESLGLSVVLLQMGLDLLEQVLQHFLLGKRVLELGRDAVGFLLVGVVQPIVIIH